MNRSLLVWPFLQLFHVFRAVVGDLTWKPPGWLTGIARRPLLWGGLLLVLVLLAGSGWRAWYWYSHLPKPLTVSWIINMGDFPDPGTEFQEQDVTLSFDASVARLELIGKDVTSLVTLSPKMPGKWTWTEGNQLQFEPTADWPAATTFHIKLAPGLFSRHAKIDMLARDFQTAPFSVAVTEPLFYVDPKDPAVKQVTATLTFSHPVDRTSLEKSLDLSTENNVPVFGAGSAVKAHVAFTYDKFDRVVYLRSDNVTVPKESAHAILTVPVAIQTTLGGAHLISPGYADIFVPSRADLFSITQAQATIVTNSEGEPEQALVLSTSVGVKPESLAKAIHAWILPKPRKHLNAETDNEVAAWDSPAEVTAEVRAHATTVPLTLVPSEQEYATLHSFKLKVPENAWVYLEVDKGLEGVGGFTLGDTFASVQRMPPYPRAVQIMHDGSILALSGERKLSILSRGVEQLEFRLARVTPYSINHLVSQSEGNFQSPIFNHYNFDESNITEQVVRRQQLASTDTSKNDYSALDFSEFVDDRDANHGKLGLFILHVLARKGGDKDDYYKADGGTLSTKEVENDGNNSYGYSRDPSDRDDLLSDRRLILVTDLGLIVKDNADGTHDIFVQSIKTGEPVDGAQVDVLGKNGIPVVSVKTDDTGRA
jgi:hypothetical protein